MCVLPGITSHCCKQISTLVFVVAVFLLRFPHNNQHTFTQRFLYYIDYHLLGQESCRHLKQHAQEFEVIFIINNEIRMHRIHKNQGSVKNLKVLSGQCLIQEKKVLIKIPHVGLEMLDYE